LAVIAGAAPSFAQSSAPAAKSSPAAKPGQATSQTSPSPPLQPAVVMPDGDKIVLMIRTTLLTLNDAVQTGNFTVLRDVAAPGFREANSAARLAQIFASLAQNRIDLAPVALITPQLAAAPTIDPKTGMLHIKGHFPGQPVQINFELLYQPIAGRWRLFGLSVAPVNAEQAAAAQGAAKHAAPKIFSKESDKTDRKKK
jgi:hypothetical protein